MFDYRAQPALRNVHVRPHTDGWCVSREHSNSAAKVYWSRRLAIDAGRELAKGNPADLLVHDVEGKIDFRVSYSGGRTRGRLGRRRRSPSSGSVPDRDDLAGRTSTLLEVLLPYDAWCLRVARRESAKALAGHCPVEMLDDLLLVITELVLEVTVQSRCSCTLLLHRTADEILIFVGDTAGDPAGGSTAQSDTSELSRPDSSVAMTDQYGPELAVDQPCLWARFNVAGRWSDDT